MNITELPPGPEPARLTAHHSAHSLREHLSAFLCTNNVGGFAVDLPPADSPLMLLLLEESEKEGCTLEGFKRIAWRLKKSADGQVKHAHCLELLAAVYGYRTYASLRASLVDGYFKRKESK